MVIVGNLCYGGKKTLRDALLQENNQPQGRKRYSTLSHHPITGDYFTVSAAHAECWE